MTLAARVRERLSLATILTILFIAPSDSLSLAPRSSTYNFNLCPNPGITYDYDLDGSQEYGFAPTNSTQFPHGFSVDIASLEVYICNRLSSPFCKASPPAVQACRNAFESYSGLGGQNAADAWNQALGLYGSASSQTYSAAASSTEYGATTTEIATVLVSGTSVPYSTIYSAVSTVYSESLTSSLYSNYAPPTYTVYSTMTISLDPNAITPTATSTSTVVLPVSVSVASVPTGTTVVVPTDGTSVTTTTLYLSTTTAQPQGTGGTGEGGGSPFSGDGRVMPLPGRLMVSVVVTIGFLLLRVW